MGGAMLLMDKNRWIWEHALRALSGHPDLFRRLLEVHGGELPLAKFGLPGILNLAGSDGLSAAISLG
jgi:hypothetical protein